MNIEHEINLLKIQISNISNIVHILQQKLQNNIGITGPPGPQ